MMKDAIDKVVNSFVPQDSFSKLPLLYNGDNELYDSIKQLFQDYKEPWSIQNIESFNSTSYDCGVISIAYIENGNLVHMNIEWEVY